MNNKQLYIEKCFNLPLFHQPFWLDIVTQNNWEVILIFENDNIVASFPYQYLHGRITMPPLTQFLGPRIINDNYKKIYQKLSWEHKLLKNIIQKLPTFKYFEQRLHFKYQNWLPFYWNGFKQTTKYTYILENLNDLNSVWKGLKDNAKNEINKAEKNLIIEADEEALSFYDFVSNSLKKKNIIIPYSSTLFQKLFKSCSENNCGKIFWAKDIQTNNRVAAIFLVWDKDTCYYLQGASSGENNSFALRFLIWHAIEYSSKFVDTFDFEGSMIEGVEHFFRSFGAIQKPYFEITKINSRFSQIKQGLNILKKAIF